MNSNQKEMYLVLTDQLERIAGAYNELKNYLHLPVNQLIEFVYRTTKNQNFKKYYGSYSSEWTMDPEYTETIIIKILATEEDIYYGIPTEWLWLTKKDLKAAIQRYDFNRDCNAYY